VYPWASCGSLHVLASYWACDLLDNRVLPNGQDRLLLLRDDSSHRFIPAENSAGGHEC